MPQLRGQRLRASHFVHVAVQECGRQPGLAGLAAMRQAAAGTEGARRGVAASGDEGQLAAQLQRRRRFGQPCKLRHQGGVGVGRWCGMPQLQPPFAADAGPDVGDKAPQQGWAAGDRVSIERQLEPRDDDVTQQEYGESINPRAVAPAQRDALRIHPRERDRAYPRRTNSGASSCSRRPRSRACTALATASSRSRISDDWSGCGGACAACVSRTPESSSENASTTRAVAVLVLIADSVTAYQCRR